MPATVDTSSSKKRKSTKNAGAPSKRRAVAEEDSLAETLSKVQELETQIAESRKYYNNIATLISMLNVEQSAKKPELAVAVSLCRVFSRLMAAGNLSESSRDAENEKIVVAWLKERCLEYQRALLSIIREADTTSQVGANLVGYPFVRAPLIRILGYGPDPEHAPREGIHYSHLWSRQQYLVWFLQRHH
jgi:U3 small nucleolar RNA-associated protein 19